jgi:16S rRNA (guanine527-N7)-methyltransferase
MKPKHKIYHDLLLKWQKTINLVSPMTLKDAEKRHFEDSLQLLNFIPDNIQTVCDIGSGAGFPGLIIAIERPDLQIHLIESDTRKCAFMRTVSRETGCENVTIHNDRIENIMDDMQCDIVTSRALASLRQLIIYTQSQWANNANFQMILPKGQNYLDEINDARIKFEFDCVDHLSQTDNMARILIVNNIAEK